MLGSDGYTENNGLTTIDPLVIQPKLPPAMTYGFSDGNEIHTGV